MSSGSPLTNASPYEYVLKCLAEDFWSVLKKEWVDTGSLRYEGYYITTLYDWPGDI